MEHDIYLSSNRFITMSCINETGLKFKIKKKYFPISSMVIQTHHIYTHWEIYYYIYVLGIIKIKFMGMEPHNFKRLNLAKKIRETMLEIIHPIDQPKAQEFILKWLL